MISTDLSGDLKKRGSHSDCKNEIFDFSSNFFTLPGYSSHWKQEKDHYDRAST